ncbi:dnaJ homolog subfamily A member 3, mitochondrial-like isoform X2 [Branchiostoma floridae]|uniref:DnaJ homolog subfamily A member 3, mitochondrial-like isoform X2 n=1 Tax=Branchiostoma floridae TaxID=7739 RepID=A0A9J7LFT8_BRAFL|nr:dnaJ homolog subfamily A member 3, mitochondrial-like isoform X2 [Branchiostoma floridae]
MAVSRFCRLNLSKNLQISVSHRNPRFPGAGNSSLIVYFRSLSHFRAPACGCQAVLTGRIAQQWLRTTEGFHTSSVCTQRKDFYKILGVSKNASQKDIKKAYYQLAKKWHPDTNKDADAGKKFAEVAEAYEILGDDQKRREYDTFGSTGAFGGAGASTGQGFSQSQWSTNIDPEELFRRVFSEFSNAGRGGFQGFDFESQFEQPQEFVMDLTFTQACRGVNKELNFTMMDSCPRCKGNKAEPGTKITRCQYCHGTGQETINTGPFMMRSTCRRCRGQGTIYSTPCILCRGQGKTQQKKSVMVPVPAGVEDGQTVRMPMGSKELFITFRVARSDYFRREGADIHTDAAISIAQAILGGNMRIKGIYDNVTIDIPRGTQSHTRLRLPGKGIKRVQGYGYGDHYVHIKIKVPDSLSAKQKALVMAYAEEERDVDGTVQGITNTQDGGKQAIEDEEGLLAKVKSVLCGDWLPKRKIGQN